MAREEEIQEKAKSLYYHFCVRETCEGEDDCANCPYGKVIEPLVSMAKWADQRPKERLWDSEKVISFLKEHATVENSSNINIHINGACYHFVNDFIEDLRKAMEV